MNMLPLATDRSCLLLPGLREAAVKGFAVLPNTPAVSMPRC